MVRKSGTEFMVMLECKHPVILVSTMPSIQSLQYCTSCDDYRRVTGYPDFFRGICLGNWKDGSYISIDQGKVRRWMERHSNSRRHTTELSKWSDNRSTKIARYDRENGWDGEVALQHFADLGHSILRDLQEGTGRTRDITADMPKSSVRPESDIVIRPIGKRVADS